MMGEKPTQPGRNPTAAPSSPMAERFGRVMRQLRRAMRLNQAEFAARLGLASQTSVSRLESGMIESLPFACIAPLLDLAAEWMGWTAADIFGGNEAKALTDAALVAEVRRRALAHGLAQMGLEMETGQPAQLASKATSDHRP